MPDGDWALTLRTTWVEPAYLETDASWARPDDEGADPLGNGGAFGGKVATPWSRLPPRWRASTQRPVRALLVA